MPYLKHIACLVLPALLMAAVQFAGVFEWLGAHPFWSLKGAMIGVAIGLGLYLLLALYRRRHRISEALLLLVFVVALVIAGALALNGKASFVMTYAQDVVGGRYWYFGYIGFCAALYLAMVSACRMVWPPERG